MTSHVAYMVGEVRARHLRQLVVDRKCDLAYLRGMGLRLRCWLRRLGIGVGCLLALFLVLQLIPYGRTHSNPMVTAEPVWDSPRTRELAKRACFDCHSNETRWPWYADVAPMSWIVQQDVEGARDTLNFSEWTRPQDLSQESGPSVIRGDMPPYKYRSAHPEANLTRDETIELARGLNATVGARGRI
jgi:Haem-binding domain